MYQIKESLFEISNYFINLEDQPTFDIQNASNLMIQSFRNDRKIMSCGNGSSATSYKEICDITINAPPSRPDKVKEMYIAIGHIICEKLELKLC